MFWVIWMFLWIPKQRSISRASLKFLQSWRQNRVKLHNTKWSHVFVESATCISQQNRSKNMLEVWDIQRCNDILTSNYMFGWSARNLLHLIKGQVGLFQWSSIACLSSTFFPKKYRRPNSGFYARPIFWRYSHTDSVQSNKNNSTRFLTLEIFYSVQPFKWHEVS